MQKKLVVLLLAATMLALPAVAVADRGGGHGHGHGGGHGKVTFQLKGFLSAFTAPVGLTPGSVTIFVTKANRAGRPFVGTTLTFMLNAKTEIEPEGAVIADGDFGSVHVKAPLDVDAAHLQAVVPKEVEDEAFEEDEDD
jgi:hypothetical protein